MCLYPKLIKNKKYTPNRKNNYNAPQYTDERTLYVPIGCGKCIECMKQKKRNWQVRLLEEIKADRIAKFVTLTFTNEAVEELKKLIIVKSLIWENDVATLAVRRFLERWRKQYKTSVKHFLITELGHKGTERIHLHGIIWTDKDEFYIWQKWEYGMIWCGSYVNEKTMNYIVKYINKLDNDHKGYVPKILCSPAIGKNYINRTDSKRNAYNSGRTNECYRTTDGSKINLPIYYRNKIYTEDERERLWLEKLDKQERFVCGEKVSVKRNEEEYLKLLDHYRRKNKRLGYGDDSKEWKKEGYVKQMNELKYQTNFVKNFNDEIKRRCKSRRNKN